MNDPKEPLIEQPEKTRAEIAEEELEKMRVENIKKEIENTKQQGDYKPEFNQYLANKGEDTNEEPLIEQPEKTRAEIAEEELEKMRVENIKKEILKNKYVGEDEELPTERSNTEEVKKTEEIKNPEEIKTPEEIKSEETKKVDLEAKEEKEARTERAIENLKALFDNKNKLFAQKEKQKDLSYKLKALFGAKDGEPVTASEYRSVYEEYGKAWKEVEALTGKSEDQIIKEYLSGKERNEDSVENVNKNLDNIEAGLEKTEEGQSKEKKDLIEKLTGIKDERVKFAIKLAIAGGMIAFPVAGIAAGALGMGLGEALIGYSFIHYSTALGLAVGNTIGAVGGIGGGGALLHKAIRDWDDAESKVFKKKPEKVSKSEPVMEKKENGGSGVSAETKDNASISTLDIIADYFKSYKENKEGNEIETEINFLRDAKYEFDFATFDEAKAYINGPGQIKLDNILNTKGKELGFLWEHVNHKRPSWVGIIKHGGIEQYINYMRNQKQGISHYHDTLDAVRDLEAYYRLAVVQIGRDKSKKIIADALKKS